MGGKKKRNKRRGLGVHGGVFLTEDIFEYIIYIKNIPRKIAAGLIAVLFKIYT